MLKMILAATKEGVIGHQGIIPWHYKEDMQWFKNKTMNCVVIMGRKTWESLGQQPLPGRYNIILSSVPKISTNKETHFFCDSFINAYARAWHVLNDKTMNHIYVIGGAQVYETTWKNVDQIELTLIKGQYRGDTRVSFLPELEQGRSFPNAQLIHETEEATWIRYSK